MVLFASGILAAGVSSGGSDSPSPPETFDKEFNVDASPYNAAGDGSIDDYMAINAALQDAKDWSIANPTDIIGVHFGSGKTYRVSRQVSVTNASNIHLLGHLAPNRPTISRHGTFDVSGSGSSQMITLLNPNSVTVWDMIFDGRRDIIPHSGAFGHLFAALGGDSFKAYRTLFYRSQAVGIKVSRYPTGNPVSVNDIPTNAYFEDCVFSHNSKQGVTSDFSYGTTFLRCIFEETGTRHGDGGLDPSAGIDIEPQDNNGVDGSFDVGNDNHTFTECIFRNNDGTGLQIGGNANIGTNRNIDVDSCVFINNGLDSPTSVRGALWIRNTEPGAPTHHIHVHGCTFRDQMTTPEAGSSKSVIYIHTLGDPSVLIEYCSFVNNTGAACLIMMRDIGEGTGLITIQNNSFDISAGLSIGTSGESNGPCAVAIQWSNVVVKGNTFIGNVLETDLVGVIVEDTGSADPSGCTISPNNIFNDLKTGIHLKAGTGINTTGNTFNNCETDIL